MKTVKLVYPEDCVKCGRCAEVCPKKVIKVEEFKSIEFDTKKCIGCGKCIIVCPNKALELVE